MPWVLVSWGEEEWPGFCLAVVLVEGSIVCSHVGGVDIKSYYRVLVSEFYRERLGGLACW